MARAGAAASDPRADSHPVRVQHLSGYGDVVRGDPRAGPDRQASRGRPRRAASPNEPPGHTEHDRLHVAGHRRPAGRAGAYRGAPTRRIQGPVRNHAQGRGTGGVHAPAPASSELDDALAILGANCPSCGEEVDPDLANCPYCGAKL